MLTGTGRQYRAMINQDDRRSWQEELDDFYFGMWQIRDSRTDPSPARIRRLHLIETALRDFWPKTRPWNTLAVLDYGCGGGWLLEHLLPFGFRELHAYDVTPRVLDEVEKKYPAVRVWRGELGFPSILPSAFFDIVTSIEVLEHIPYQQQSAYFEDLRRIMRSDALAILTTPNGRWKDTALSPKQAQPIEDWVTLRRLENLAKQSGFRVLASGTKGINRYGRADRVLQSYRLKNWLTRVNRWELYERFLERRGRGITMYAYLLAE